MLKKLCASLVVLLLLVSCSGKKEDEKITLQYWTHEDPARNKLENEFIAEFQKTHPNVTIVRTTQGSSKQIELVQTAFAANQGPDIFTLPIEDGYAYISNGRVAAVNPEAAGFKSQADMENEYANNFLTSVTKDGKVYALPLEVVNWCIYINKNIFKSAGLDPEKDYPKTWEEMMAVSEKLVIRNGDILVRRGFDFRYPFYLVALVPMVEQLGGKLVSDDGKTAIVNDDAWLAVLNYMKEWGTRGKNLGSPTYKNARKIFDNNNNEVAMCHSGLYQEARILADNPDFYNSKEWMVVPFPVFENAVNNLASCYYGQFLMVNGSISPAKQKVAWEFIGYMLSHAEDYLTRGGGLMQPTKKLLSSEALKNMPYSDVFINDMARAKMVYYGANSAQLQNAIRSAVEQVMLSGIDPKEALKTLKLTCQEIIDENN